MSLPLVSTQPGVPGIIALGGDAVGIVAIGVSATLWTRTVRRRLSVSYAANAMFTATVASSTSSTVVPLAAAPAVFAVTVNVSPSANTIRTLAATSTGISVMEMGPCGNSRGTKSNFWTSARSPKIT